MTNIVGGLILLPGVTGSNVRHGVHAVESLIDSGDELAQFIGAAGKCRRNSFSEETPVATDEGAVPIGEIDVGDRVLAWNEFTDTTGYYTVSATFSHVDATIVELTIAGETLETTADHPFYVVADAPWLAVGETQGRWIEAGNLQVGDAVLQADGTTGAVAAVKVVVQPQRMYNLTVADAHTFFVGDGEWLVHNCGSIVTGTYKELRSAGLKDAHHIFQDAAMRDIPLYDRDAAPAIVLVGPSTKVGSPHYLATRVQEKLVYGGGNYASERRMAYRALRTAGISQADARKAIEYADEYFHSIGVLYDAITRIPGNRH